MDPYGLIQIKWMNELRLFLLTFNYTDLVIFGLKLLFVPLYFTKFVYKNAGWQR